MTDTYEFRNLLVIQDKPKAWKVEQTIRGRKYTQWVPKSVCTYVKEHKEPTYNIVYLDLIIEEWFVLKDDFCLIV